MFSGAREHEADLTPRSAPRHKRDRISLNNNRNNRRRGRNNNRNQGGGNSANRIDSRARGNAPQLLDKYKKLAQDAQHNGDRVQAEYYLQFADHYFRVIADNKARQDEAKSKRDEERGNQENMQADAGEEDGDERGNRRPRARRDNADGKQDIRQRKPRRQEKDDDNAETDREEPPRKRRAPRKTARGEEGVPGNEGEIDVAALPPAIGADDEASAPAAPTRRRRKSAEGEDLSAVG